MNGHRHLLGAAKHFEEARRLAQTLGADESKSEPSGDSSEPKQQ